MARRSAKTIVKALACSLAGCRATRTDGVTPAFELRAHVTTTVHGVVVDDLDAA